MRDLMENKYILMGISAVASASVAAGVSYVLTKRALDKKWSEILDEEVANTKAHYAKLYKSEEYSDPIKLAEVYEEESASDYIQDSVEKMIHELKYTSSEETQDEIETIRDVEKQIEVQESITKNIFDNKDPVEDDDFDVEYEKEHVRDSSSPYIISHDEFFEAEMDYEQTTLTYYEGDDVLTDDKDQPIRDLDRIVGEDNIQFGRGSKDKNVVYIRNEKLMSDFEVTRSFGSYTEEVLGFAPKQPSAPKVRKFKDFD